ncbi:hypothetical protein [Streptomyces sp. NBC_01477]|uniref:hypothetical protein n=1 Tax=Streptomyces sp. NBC_01477 TaxID=2976015 RepID=UPI002E340E06|nr:hypothetical protein [Streptomyces sp. NBC_01477]
MKQVLIFFKYASCLSPRTLALAVTSTVLMAAISAVLIWAPPERANLVVTLVGPILAAVAVATFDSRRRRR